MASYSTLSESINNLRREGHTEAFHLLRNCLECRDGTFPLFADEFKVGISSSGLKAPAIPTTQPSATPSPPTVRA